LMMLSLDTAYRSFGGEVEASSTPTICRLSDSRRHQLSAIAPDVRPVAALGQSRHFDRAPLASGLPQLADILRGIRHVSNVPLTDSCPSKRHLQSPILTALEQACFASSGAQKRSINGHFAVIFEKPSVAVQAQNFCFKSPILRPLSDSSQSTGRCGRRWHPNWQIAGELLRVVRNSLLGSNGVFRMGVASWRFARNHRGRAAVLVVLEELPGICSVVVAVGSMIMLGIMLCKDWPQ
jgi:hypothetical protein